MKNNDEESFSFISFELNKTHTKQTTPQKNKHKNQKKLDIKLSNLIVKDL